MAGQRAINMARGLGYMAGILSKHQSEPLCGKCKAFVSTTEKVRASLSEFSGSSGEQKLPDEIRQLFIEAKSMLDGLRVPDEPIPQRKAGNCILPEKGCFLKYSLAFFENLTQ